MNLPPDFLYKIAFKCVIFANLVLWSLLLIPDHAIDPTYLIGPTLVLLSFFETEFKENKK